MKLRGHYLFEISIALLTTLVIGGALTLRSSADTAADVSAILAKAPAQGTNDHLVVIGRYGAKLGSFTGGVSDSTLATVVMPSKESSSVFALADGDEMVEPVLGAKPVNESTPSPLPSSSSPITFLGTPVPNISAPGVVIKKQSDAPFDLRSGALHGVRSKNGYSGLSAYVSIPCGGRATLEHEIGFIYVGGWGAGNFGTAVDAGLQASTKKSRSGDNYAFYWLYEGYRAPNAHAITYPENLRFPCGSDRVHIVFYPISDTLLYYSARGMINGHSVTLAVVQVTDKQDGWWPRGGSSDDGIILKRMVTIAQPPEWNTPGPGFRKDARRHNAWFGIGTDGRPLITWSDCRIGHTSDGTTGLSPWTSAETWKSSTAISNYPIGAVKVANAPGTCEAVGIDLKKAQI